MRPSVHSGSKIRTSDPLCRLEQACLASAKPGAWCGTAVDMWNWGSQGFFSLCRCTLFTNVLCILGCCCADTAGPSLVSWGHSAAHCITVAEPCSGHCLGVLAAVLPPPQGLQSHCPQNQEPALEPGIQCVEGVCCPNEPCQAAVQESPWRLLEALL